MVRVVAVIVTEVSKIAFSSVSFSSDNCIFSRLKAFESSIKGFVVSSTFYS